MQEQFLNLNEKNAPMAEAILEEQIENVGKILLTQPNRVNSFNDEMHRDLRVTNQDDQTFAEMHSLSRANSGHRLGQTDGGETQP